MRGSTGVATIGAVLTVVSGAEILTHGPLTKLDLRVAVNYLPIAQTRTTDVGRILQTIGQPWIACVVIGSLGPLAALVIRKGGPAAAAATALGGVGISTLALKHVFPHPAIYSHMPGSFPSGHTGVAVVASGLIVYLLLPQRRWRESVALTAAAIWGAVMAWGRLITEAHWLSDVVAGWGIGMCVLVMAIRMADWPLDIRGWARLVRVDTR